MKSVGKFSILLVFILIAVLLVSCTGAQAPAASDTSTEAKEYGMIDEVLIRDHQPLR